MSFYDDWKAYLDDCGMPLHTGNPMLELGTAIAVEPELRTAMNSVYSLAIDGYHRLRIREGLIAKKLTDGCKKSTDQVTFDDMRGLAALGPTMAVSILSEANSHTFFGLKLYSNTGKFYWSAIVRPWDLAYLEILANKKTHPFKESILCRYLGSQTSSYDISSGRMTWLMCKTLLRFRGKKDMSSRLLGSIKEFMDKLDRDGGIHRIFKEYHGAVDPNHPFIQYTS